MPSSESAVLTAMLQRFRGSGQAFAVMAHNHNLARMQFSFGAAWTAEWAFTVALGVLAFRNGGRSPRSAWSASCAWRPPALLAPLASTLADRFARDRVLIWSSLLRAAATALAALVLVSRGPIAATYALATLAACVFILFRAAPFGIAARPLQHAVELTSATMARGLVDSISTLVGPLLAGLLLSVTSVAATFAIIAALAAVVRGAAGTPLVRGATAPRAPAAAPHRRRDHRRLPRHLSTPRRRAALRAGAGADVHARLPSRLPRRHRVRPAPDRAGRRGAAHGGGRGRRHPRLGGSAGDGQRPPPRRHPGDRRRPVGLAAGPVRGASVCAVCRGADVRDRDRQRARRRRHLHPAGAAGPGAPAGPCVRHAREPDRADGRGGVADHPCGHRRGWSARSARRGGRAGASGGSVCVAAPAQHRPVHRRPRRRDRRAQARGHVPAVAAADDRDAWPTT